MTSQEFIRLQIGTRLLIEMPEDSYETKVIFDGISDGQIHFTYTDDENGNGVSYPERNIEEVAKRTRLEILNEGDQTMPARYEAWEECNGETSERIVFNSETLQGAKTKATKHFDVEFGRWEESTVDFTPDNTPIYGWKKAPGQRESAIGLSPKLYLRETGKLKKLNSMLTIEQVEDVKELLGAASCHLDNLFAGTVEHETGINGNEECFTKWDLAALHRAAEVIDRLEREFDGNRKRKSA